MKKQTSHGFTLVELIIVMAILAILSTVSFVGYSSYIASARDTKRIGSMTLINNTIKKLILQWYNPLPFVADSANKGTSAGQFFLKWRDITGLAGYNAGNIAMDSIPDLPKENVDPKTKSSYRIGTYGGEYQIAATLEDTKSSYILGSFKKRTSTGTLATLAWAPDTTNNILTLSNLNDALKFNAGDIISTGTATPYEISSVAGTKLYMSGSVSGILASDTIRLAANDTDIIGNASKGSTASVTNCSDPTQTSTIAANLCPISDAVIGLVPYKVD